MDTELKHCVIYAIPYWAIESCLEVGKKVVCFVSLRGFGVVEYLVDGGLDRSEAALMRFNQCLGVGLQSFTQYGPYMRSGEDLPGGIQNSRTL